MSVLDWDRVVLGADRTLDGVANVGDDLKHGAAGLGDQGGIGGDAVHQAGHGQVLEDGHVGGVEEKLHR